MIELREKEKRVALIALGILTRISDLLTRPVPSDSKAISPAKRLVEKKRRDRAQGADYE